MVRSSLASKRDSRPSAGTPPRVKKSVGFSVSVKVVPEPDAPGTRASSKSKAPKSPPKDSRPQRKNRLSGPEKRTTRRGSVKSLEPGPEASRAVRCCRPLIVLRRKVAPHCRWLNRTKVFQALMFLALLSALFLPDIWILADQPDNRNLDIVLTVVLVAFVFELVVQSVGLTRSYLGSFFFWMDLLGAVSVLLDLSYLVIISGGGDGVASNVVVMRAARIAKLGARAGRFTKLMKLMRFLPGIQEPVTDAGTAKAISSRLITALSTRVSCLIIVMVMVMPLFSMWTYPELDRSMESWLDVLEKTKDRSPGDLARQLQRMEDFYSDRSYHPYSLQVKPGQQLPPGSTVVLPWTSRGAPRRMTNSVRHESATFVCDFDFRGPHQIDSLMNVLLLLVVMVLMVGFSLVLSNSVSRIVLRPLEQLLLQVRNMADTIFRSVTDMACTMRDPEEEGADDSEEEDDGSAFGNETALLEKVVTKLAVLSEITMNKSMVGVENMEGLGRGDEAVLHGFLGRNRGTLAWQDELGADFDEIIGEQKTMLQRAGLSLELVNSWNLNPLDLDPARIQAAMTFFMGTHSHGVRVDPSLMAQFLESAESSYKKSVPYHNWFHAVDVTHGVNRLLQVCSADAYLSCHERFALLVAAVGHDLGHPGVNNHFIIETAHELALLYNDRSPLENMHCARLFQITFVAKCNIFASLHRVHYQEVRKTIIDAVLNTDNAMHFTMIKEVQMMYEVNSELLDVSREMFTDDSESFPIREAMECFREPDTRRLLAKVFLHTADISNSLKPFRISRLWAMMVLEEFFLQGDQEMRMGIPVQALNDRNKVNRPFSQVGFIEFLVSPLVFAVIRVLPPMDGLAEQMMQNLRMWHSQWYTETRPPPTGAELDTLVERVKKIEAKFSEARG